MEGVERVQCHRTSLELSVISASIQDVWDVLEPGDILHGGPGWGCVDTQANDPEAGVPFYFKVVRKVSLGSDSIHLETRPVSAFSVFERASITMWKDDVSSPLSSRRNAGPGSAGGLHTSTPPRSSVPRSHHPPTTKPLVHFGNSTGRAARQRGGTDAHLDAYDVVDSSTVALPHLDLVWTKDSSALGLSMYGTGDASVTLGVDLSITVGYFYNLEMTYSGSVDSCTMYVVATPVVELSLDATAQASSTLKVSLLLHSRAHACLACAQEASLGVGPRGWSLASLQPREAPPPAGGGPSALLPFARAPPSTAQPACSTLNLSPMQLAGQDEAWGAIPDSTPRLPCA